MALRYFHLRGADEAIDSSGLEVEAIEDVRSVALKAARDVMCGDIRDGRLDLRLRIDVESAEGDLVYSLPFLDAVTLSGARDGLEPIGAA